MRRKPFCLVLYLALVLNGGLAYGQGSLGAKPKKARTPDDYKPRTLKEIAAEAPDAESRRDKQDRMIVHGDILPSRVRVTYKSGARPLPPIKQEVLRQWAWLYAGVPEHYTAPYETEMLFTEDGMEHWLAVNKKLLPQFEEGLKEGEAIDLYVIRLGGVRTEGKWELVLLVETFARPKTIPRQ